MALTARIADGYYCAWPARAVATAHAMWRHELMPGQGGQDLPTTTHFKQAAATVTSGMAAAVRVSARPGLPVLWVGFPQRAIMGRIQQLEQEELDLLRERWGGSYEISHPGENDWTAVRRDQRGVLHAKEPDQLWLALREDCGQ